MVELLQLTQAALTFTAVTITAVTLPVAMVSDTEIPDLKPLIEVLEEQK